MDSGGIVTVQTSEILNKRNNKIAYQYLFKKHFLEKGIILYYMKIYEKVSEMLWKNLMGFHRVSFPKPTDATETSTCDPPLNKFVSLNTILLIYVII